MGHLPTNSGLQFTNSIPRLQLTLFTAVLIEAALNWGEIPWH